MDTSFDIPSSPTALEEALSAAVARVKGGVANPMGYQGAVAPAALLPPHNGPPRPPRVGQYNKVIASALSHPAFHPALNTAQQGADGNPAEAKWEWWHFAPIDQFKMHTILRSYDGDLPGIQAAAAAHLDTRLAQTDPPGAPVVGPPAGAVNLQFNLANAADQTRFIDLAYRMIRHRWADMVKDGLPQIAGDLGRPMWPQLPATWERGAANGMLNDGGGLHREWRWQLKLVRLVDRIPNIAQHPALLTAAQMRRFLQSSRQMFDDTWTMVRQDHCCPPPNNRADGFPTSSSEAMYSGSALTVFHTQEARNYSGMIRNPRWEFVARHFLAAQAARVHPALPAGRRLVGFYYAEVDGGGNPAGAIVPAGAPGAPVGPIPLDQGGAVYAAAMMDGQAPPAAPGVVAPVQQQAAAPGVVAPVQQQAAAPVVVAPVQQQAAAPPAAPVVVAPVQQQAAAAAQQQQQQQAAAAAAAAGNIIVNVAIPAWNVPQYVHFSAGGFPVGQMPMQHYLNPPRDHTSFAAEHAKGVIGAAGNYKASFKELLGKVMSKNGFCTRKIPKPGGALGDVFKNEYKKRYIKHLLGFDDMNVFIVTCPPTAAGAQPDPDHIVSVAFGGYIQAPDVHEGGGDIEFLPVGKSEDSLLAPEDLGSVKNPSWDDLKIVVNDEEYTGDAANDTHNITDHFYDMPLVCSNATKFHNQRRFTKQETAAATKVVMDRLIATARAELPQVKFVVIEVGGVDWEAKKRLFDKFYAPKGYVRARYYVNANAGAAGHKDWRIRNQYFFAALLI